MGEQRRADLGGERRSVDDAARALSDEMSRRDLIGEEYAARIDGEVEIPFGVSKVKRALHCRNPGIGDADVATPQELERLVEGALDRGALAHVDRNRDRACADFLRRSLGPVGIDIGDRHFHAALRERVRNGAANAIRAAGYERAPAAKLRIGRTGRRH
jgi:hypothetical protein